jgi:PBSX family phage terminase large subunit
MSSPLRFSEKQMRVLTWWSRDDGRDAIIADGAIRSGKTISMGLGFVFWAQRRFDCQQFALCGKTIGALRRNLLRDLLPRLRELGFSCSEHRTDHDVTIRFGGHENRFLLFGGRDESSAALIQGSTFAGVLLDEVALMPRSFVEQALARCSVPGSRLWFNCNPEGPQHWFYREWIQRAEEHHALYLHFTMDDNPGLTPRVRARYKSAYSGIFYRRFVLGEWTAAEGLVYDFFDRDRDCVPPPRDCARWRVSVDYGTTNPASFGLWGEKNGVWYRVGEYYYDSRAEGRQKTDAEYVSDLKALIGGRKVERIVADPSAASFLAALRQTGLPAVKADNDVLNGIRVTADLLKRRRLVICDSCTDCLREMELYCWEDSASRERPRKENDHAMDDLRYFAMDAAAGTGLAATWVERRT